MFSKTTEYALRATIFIAQKGLVDHKLGIDEIALAIDSPKSFTAKILQSLTKDNKVICSVKGPNGGFFMNDKQKELPIRSVLNAMDDDGILRKCVLGLKRCSELNPCPLHVEYKRIREELNELFEGKTIGELALETDKKDIFINNDRH